MSQSGVKSKTSTITFGGSSSSKTPSPSENVKPRKSLKRPVPDSPSKTSDDDDNENSIQFLSEPRPSKKPKKDSNVLKDVENKKNKSETTGKSKKKSLTSDKHNEDGLPSEDKPKKKKKKQSLPKEKSSETPTDKPEKKDKSEKLKQKKKSPPPSENMKPKKPLKRPVPDSPSKTSDDDDENSIQSLSNPQPSKKVKKKALALDKANEDALPSEDKPKKKKKQSSPKEKLSETPTDKPEKKDKSEKPKKTKQSSPKEKSSETPTNKPEKKDKPEKSKKKKSPPSSIKKSTQQSILGFCQPQSPAVSLEKAKDKAKGLYEEALEAVKSGQMFTLKQVLHAATKLSESAIDSVESEFFKFAVLRNRKYDDEENEINQKYENMLAILTKNVLEDTSINPKPFPDIKAAIEETHLMDLYGSCLAISQFFATFSTFLDSDFKFSAEDLLKAIHGGMDGYYKLTGQLLAEFMHTFSIYDWFKGYKFFTSKLADIKFDGKSASEICKLFLLRKYSPSTRKIMCKDGKLKQLFEYNKKNMSATAKPHKEELDSELAEYFLEHEFFELEPEQQIAIFEHLMDLLITSEIFNKQFIQEECKVVPKEKIDVLRKNYETAKAEWIKYQSARTKAGKKPDKTMHRPTKTAEFALAKAERTKTLFKLHNALKPAALILGYDRFHRRYLVFPNSPNKGLFIEEFCHISLDEETEFPNDELAIELEKYTIESGRIPLQRSQWYLISSEEEFKEIQNALSKRGFRESLLLESIEKNAAQISEAFNTKYQNISMKFNEGESELDLLKNAITQVLQKAQKYSFIHFSTSLDELKEAIATVENFDDLRNSIVEAVSAILPCAYNPFEACVAFFRISTWINYMEICKSPSQMFALLQQLSAQIRTDTLFGSTPCPRCDRRFEKNITRSGRGQQQSVIACFECYGFIHLKCHNAETEKFRDPEKPLWICENCKKPADDVAATAETKDVENEDGSNGEEEDDEDEEEDDLEAKGIIVGNRVLRATKARERHPSASETGASSRGSSRASEWDNATTRSLRSRTIRYNYEGDDDGDDESDSDVGFIKPKNPKVAKVEKPVKHIDPEILERYQAFRKNYRIVHSLSPIPFEACGYDDVKIESLKSHLHKLKNVKELDSALKNLYAAAKVHFENNLRKLDSIVEYFDEFFGYSDDIEMIDGNEDADSEFEGEDIVIIGKKPNAKKDDAQSDDDDIEIIG